MREGKVSSLHSGPRNAGNPGTLRGTIPLSRRLPPGWCMLQEEQSNDADSSRVKRDAVPGGLGNPQLLPASLSFYVSVYLRAT